MENTLITFLRLFRNISGTEAELILNATESRTYKDGEYLFKGGNICHEMFFIVDGVLRIMVFNERGNEVTHFFLKPNQFCTIMNSFANRVKAHESICAACNTDVLVLNKARLDQLYQQLPYLKELIDQITRQALLDKIALRNTYLGLDSTARYKAFMTQQPEISLRVSLSDIASYLGITPQSLSRIRKNMHL